MRWLLNCFALLLLVPLLLAGTMWVRSYNVSDELCIDLAHRDGSVWNYARHGVISGRGRLVYCRRGWIVHRAPDDPPAVHIELNAYKPIEPWRGYSRSTNALGRWGFAAEKELWGEVGARAFIMPLWAPTAVSAIIAVPALLLARRAARIAFRRKNGLCIRCGYDLRESKERCPECGCKTHRGMGASPMLVGTTSEALVPRES